MRVGIRTVDRRREYIAPCERWYYSSYVGPLVAYLSCCPLRPPHSLSRPLSAAAAATSGVCFSLPVAGLLNPRHVPSVAKRETSPLLGQFRVGDAFAPLSTMYIYMYTVLSSVRSSSQCSYSGAVRAAGKLDHLRRLVVPVLPGKPQLRRRRGRSGGTRARRRGARRFPQGSRRS